MPEATHRHARAANLTVRAHQFAAMAANYPNTAASLIPLIVLNDILNERFEREAQFHTDFYSLYIIRRGKGTHVIEGREYGIARGDVYAMAPGMAHHFYGSESLLADTLHFSASIFQPEEHAALANSPGFRAIFVEPTQMRGQRWLHLTPDSYKAVSEQIAEMKSEWAKPTPESALLTRALFLRLFIRLSRLFAQTERLNRVTSKPLGDHETTVANALRFMEANFTRTVRITEIANVVCLSPDRFSDVFTEAMGRTPRDYLRYLRVERAKQLLTSTDTPIGEIAAAVGFNDAAYLTRVLRAATGMPPRELRNAALAEGRG